ncbi:Poly(A)+ RNA export protein rae1 [Homalodisca vitripennis]|nr:Poly(A)+ RNA export protein rae1 [Homalodisca vitripennis]
MNYIEHTCVPYQYYKHTSRTGFSALDKHCNCLGSFSPVCGCADSDCISSLTLPGVCDICCLVHMASTAVVWVHSHQFVDKPIAILFPTSPSLGCRSCPWGVGRVLFSALDKHCSWLGSFSPVCGCGDSDCIYSLTLPGYALGSVEGRVAIQYVNPTNPKENFTFKCHRSNGAQGGYQDIYAVNDIAFHPVHGTLATVGSDGTFSFWDKDARTKLKPSETMEQAITKCAFNHNGQIFAYSVSYDWSKGHEFYNPSKKNYIFLRSCYDELKPRTSS